MIWVSGRPGFDLRQRQRILPSNLCVQTGSGAHPASRTMGTGGKAQPGRDADHSPPSSAKVKEESGAISPVTESAPMACSGTTIFFRVRLNMYRFIENVLVLTIVKKRLRTRGQKQESGGLLCVRLSLEATLLWGLGGGFILLVG
jgi:hypothetical protein